MKTYSSKKKQHCKTQRNDDDENVDSSILCENINPYEEIKKTLIEINLKDDYDINYSKLKKYKLIYIKQCAKENNLHVTGNKEILIKRIIDFLLKRMNITLIQKRFRGYIVRESFRLRGPAFLSFADYKNVGNKCVNETDPYSLDPIYEISFEKFISIADSANFIYGFDISYLIKAINRIEKNEILMNPYRRENFPQDVLNNIIKLNNILSIIFPGIIWEKSVSKNENQTRYQTTRRNNRSTTRIITREIYPNNVTDNEEETNIVLQENTNGDNLFINENVVNQINHMIEPTTEGYLNIVNFSILYNSNQLLIYNKLLSLQRQSVTFRIRELFIEIDILGNYTQSSWFSNLTNIECIRFYNYLFEIWSYRGQLLSNTKKSICQLYDPFTNTIQYLNNTNRIKEICLSVMENIIYSGINDDYRKIGAYHILTALTFVSLNARLHLRWLYESYYF